MRKLTDKFIHKNWYRNANLTIKDFLELACNNTMIFLKDDTLKDEEESGHYKLNKTELDYYLSRKKFYSELKAQIREQNKEAYTNEYFTRFLDIEENELNKITEYREAQDKFLQSIRG